LSLESAWHLSPNVVHEESMEELVAKADYITLHIPLNDKTRNTFDEKLFAATKPGARLLNFARGGLVDNAALKKAIADGIIARYMTDFPSEDLLGDPANIIVTPHLGASTPESEENCAIMAAQEIREYLTHGNIKNSVNFPNCVVPYNGKPRITVCHQNIVNMIGQLGAVFTKYSVNIDKLVNNSKGDLAYNIVVCDNLPENIDDMIKDLYAINTVLKVRILD
ncbi:MAG: 3-phosphoglycerate dehydrogenase, partial [Anaerotignum sp.]|nr:3-phosphoglycerate dehydrogenase [Anaerotignum sp.]